MRPYLRIDNSRRRVICTTPLFSPVFSETMILITVQYLSNERSDFSLSYDINDVVIE